MRRYEEQVRRGIVWLDEYLHDRSYDWRNEVDLDVLDMGSYTMCVGGQLDVFGELPDPMYDYGFNVEDDPVGGMTAFVELRDEWRRQLSTGSTT